MAFTTMHITIYLVDAVTKSVMPAIHYAVEQMIPRVFAFPTSCFDLIMKIHGEEKLVCIIVMN